MKRDDGEDAAAHPHVRHAASGQAVDRFLALLQDRLPLWLRILHDLSNLIGKGNVNDNLLPIARAGIDYYADVHSAQLPAFTSPRVTVRFREAQRDAELGPMSEIQPLADYLAAEQRAGRVRADVDPVGSARLFLAGCFRRAYDELFSGAGAGPSRDDCAEEIVRELRLTPAAPPGCQGITDHLS
ncbi:TetR/AcrR family transcriptional regulator C-terminal domain-containing protein [Sinosporangium album]|nr:TetR/AcrR family transcriptional regulator C-terminal domain-containing protein [Sinosporangium album]